VLKLLPLRRREQAPPAAVPAQHHLLEPALPGRTRSTTHRLRQRRGRDGGRRRRELASFLLQGKWDGNENGGDSNTSSLQVCAGVRAREREDVLVSSSAIMHTEYGGVRQAGRLRHSRTGTGAAQVDGGQVDSKVSSRAGRV
jgi:hypothetical protein